MDKKMENEMETGIIGLFKVLGLGFRVPQDLGFRGE